MGVLPSLIRTRPDEHHKPSRRMPFKKSVRTGTNHRPDARRLSNRAPLVASRPDAREMRRLPRVDKVPSGQAF
jgi:hypothetical protein